MTQPTETSGLVDGHPRDGRPLPLPDADSRPYWEAADQGLFMFQRCRACSRPQFYARALCRHCHATDLAWEQASGDGSIASFTRVSRAPSQAFAQGGPYVIALVDLDEGVRFLCNVIDSPHEEVRIGARVQVVFEARVAADGQVRKLPQVKLRAMTC